MGKRAVMLQCPECDYQFWHWLEWLSMDELKEWADDRDCPECGFPNPTLTDASQFAGGTVTGESAADERLRQFERRIRDIESTMRKLSSRISDVEESDDS